MGPVGFHRPIKANIEHPTSNVEKSSGPALCLAAPLLSSANAGSEDSNKFDCFLEKRIDNVG
jgi:hypothetical protein